MKQKTCIIIAGPTASGKTALAIELARAFRTDIISADSRQCYKELSIGVAKPAPNELQAVKHHFINSHSIRQEVNAMVFENYALQAAEQVFKERDVVVMAGGTGLYIKAFCGGLDDMPPASAAVRASILSQYERQGLSWLQQQVQQQDPLYYNEGEIQNPQRLIRALEVMQVSGRSIRSYQRGEKAERNFRIIKTGLALPREKLYARINRRAELMMEQGLEEEVKALLPFRHLNALQTVGYRELFEYFDGWVSKEAAVENIKTNTRHYAKRQLTWFKKDAGITWFSPYDVKEIFQYCSAQMV